MSQNWVTHNCKKHPPAFKLQGKGLSCTLGTDNWKIVELWKMNDQLKQNFQFQTQGLLPFFLLQTLQLWGRHTAQGSVLKVG